MPRTLALLVLLAVASTGCMTAIASFQPQVGDVLILTMTDAEGVRYQRVLTPIDHDEKLYLSANHWPRAWFRRALAHPNVEVERGGDSATYRAVPVSGDELARLEEAAAHPFLVRLGMAFAPREFLRLDPL